MKKIKVALADDHTLFRSGIISILKTDDRFEVVGDVANGEELIELFESSGPPDVCLLDINMPKMDGYATLKLLKGKYPGLKFLILSMHIHEFIVIKMLKNGASGFINKDIEPMELKKAIKAVQENAYYHSDLVSGHIISLVQKGDEYTKLSLNDKEQEFLKYSCSDMTYKQIADKMNISRRTVEGYREVLFNKLQVKSRTGLAIFALKLGLITTDEFR